MQHGYSKIIFRKYALILRIGCRLNLSKYPKNGKLKLKINSY